MVIAKNKEDLRGTMILSNADKEFIKEHKDELSEALTQQVRADAKNSGSKVEVSDIRQLNDGTVALAYECQHVSNQETAKKSLEKAVNDDNVKKTVMKSSRKAASDYRQRRKNREQKGE